MSERPARTVEEVAEAIERLEWRRLAGQISEQAFQQQAMQLWEGWLASSDPSVGVFRDVLEVVSSGQDVYERVRGIWGQWLSRTEVTKKEGMDMDVVLGSLKGKVAVVTGGGQRIGQEYALALAGQGARVLVADVADGSETVEKIRSLGGEGLYVKTDVTSEADTAAMAQAAADRWGSIDILINNAAIYGAMHKGTIEQLTVADWQSMMTVNVTGVWLVSRAVVPHMRARGRGKIVNIASGVSFVAPPQMAHYVASKSGVIGLTRAMARELGPDRINVNAVSPGLVDNEASQGLSTPEYMSHGAQLRVLKRPMEQNDLVGTVLFLCSELSDFVTGQNLVVDGGAIFQ